MMNNLISSMIIMCKNNYIAYIRKVAIIKLASLIANHFFEIIIHQLSYECGNGVLFQ